MLLIPGVKESEVTERMEASCAALSQFGKRVDGKVRRPLSYGIIEVKVNNKRTASQILAEADERMYALKAKHKAEFQDEIRR